VDEFQGFSPLSFATRAKVKRIFGAGGGIPSLGQQMPPKSGSSAFQTDDVAPKNVTQSVAEIIRNTL